MFQLGRGRLRSTLKWSGASVCLLIAATWLASRWYELGVVVNTGSSGYGCAVMAGELALITTDAPDRGLRPWHPRFTLTRTDLNAWMWWFHWNRWTNFINVSQCFIPLWTVLLPFAGTSLWVVVRSHRATVGVCPHCRYNLSGLPPNSPCPECGTPNN